MKMQSETLFSGNIVLTAVSLCGIITLAALLLTQHRLLHNNKGTTGMFVQHT
jgi:hypothetical protein